MADLRGTFEELGLAEVETYIASGNVLFRAPRQKREELAARIESALAKRFGVELKVVLLTASQLSAVVDGAPRGFGGDDYRCDVIFLRKPLTAKRAFGLFDAKDGRRRAVAGQGRRLLLAPCREGLEQPALEHRRRPRVQGDDDPQLEHDDEAPHPARRARLARWVRSRG